MTLPIYAPSPLFAQHGYVRVKNEEASAFYFDHHYAKGVANNVVTIGYCEGAKLTACVSFGTSCSENVRASLFGPEKKDGVKELQRLARSPECTLPMSQFVSHAIALYLSYRQSRDNSPLCALLSFADEYEGHHGGVYQAMSWLYCGVSIAHVLTHRDAEGRLRHRRQNGLNVNEHEACLRGWTSSKEEHTKHRYVKILGSKAQRKALRKALLFPVLPYPKPSA